MEKVKILWVDDEIDLLQSHLRFLKDKGYEISTANNGTDALDLLKKNFYDILFLDENMPGLSGIQLLEKISSHSRKIPVVMITKSEEENIMDEALGANIADYLIKPVNPNQILLCIKKIIDNKELISKKTTEAYRAEFNKIGASLNERMNFKQWCEIYKKIVFWEMKLQDSQDDSMKEILYMQKEEANNLFAKYISKNYAGWLQNKIADKPVMSQNLLKEYLLPRMQNNKTLFLIVIDNFRYDQWKTVQTEIENFYIVESEQLYSCILPSSTQYARNSLFSGLLPSEIEKKYPQYWLNEEDEGNKNQFEPQLLTEFFKRYGKNIKTAYYKVLNYSFGKKLAESIPNLFTNNLVVIVYNFVDMLSHARTEMEIIKELANDATAYRSLTLSWFNHSPLLDIIKQLAEKQADIAITTDHGSIQVTNPIKIVGDKEINANLRYKYGKNMQFDKNTVMEIKNPAEVFLPQPKIASNYIFTGNGNYFCYPNNYNQFATLYKNTFQHGGISMEELLIPFIYLKAK